MCPAEGRQDLIDYAMENNIPVKQTKEVDGGASFSVSPLSRVVTLLP